MFDFIVVIEEGLLNVFYFLFFEWGYLLWLFCFWYIFFLGLWKIDYFFLVYMNFRSFVYNWIYLVDEILDFEFEFKRDENFAKDKYILSR